MILLFLLILCLSFLTGCQAESLQNREIFVVSVADDFYGYNGSKKRLNNVITDQAALLSQLSTWGDIQITAFISEKGERYISSSPKYVPVDKDGIALSDQSDSAFRGFSFRPQAKDKKTAWTMKTVLDEIISLPALEDDLVLFFYSGHGEEGTGSLITNAEKDSALYDTIGVSNVLDALEAVGGKKVAFIDSCYSGYFLPSTKLAGTDVFQDAGKSFWDHFSVRNAFSGNGVVNNRKDLWLLVSATSGQKAYDSLDYEDSVFQKYYGGVTYYLLKALGYDTEKNLPRKEERQITFYGLYRKIRWDYPYDALAFQTPQASLGGIDLILRE